MSLREAEKKDPEWWLNHHKQSVKYLVIRIHQLLNSEGKGRQQLENILSTVIVAFAESVEVDLDEVKIS
jgi:hypothetical protein